MKKNIDQLIEYWQREMKKAQATAIITASKQREYECNGIATAAGQIIKQLQDLK